MSENDKITAKLTVENVVTPTPEEPDEKLKEIQIIPSIEPTEPVIEEKEELTEEEKKHELFIKSLKESKLKFRSISCNGNITTNKFGVAYRKKRKRRNRIQNKSRKNNR
jgi:hypothetical protein